MLRREIPHRKTTPAATERSGSAIRQPHAPCFVRCPFNRARDRHVKLMNVVDLRDRFVYEYDFGDDWKYQIVVEKIVTREEGQSYPVCVVGARACPPEYCGGTWGTRTVW